MRKMYIPGFSPTRNSKRTLLPTPACPAPSYYVASWHSTTRACAVLVVASAMAALLLSFFAEVGSFILALIVVSYGTYVAFCHVRDISTDFDFETDGVSERCK